VARRHKALWRGGLHGQEVYKAAGTAGSPRSRLRAWPGSSLGSHRRAEAVGFAGSPRSRSRARRSKPNSSVVGRWGSTGTRYSSFFDVLEIDCDSREIDFCEMLRDCESCDLIYVVNLETCEI
jgi:hypothetical protein